MANAKLRRKAHEGLRELNAHELGAVSGAWAYTGPGTGGGYFDVNGGDWYRNNRHGRLAVRSNPDPLWGMVFG